MTTSEQLRRGAAKLGIDLGAERLDQLERYFLELKKWNRSINLVAAAPDLQLLESHFLDSLTLLPLLDPCPPPGLIDVGSGAGFPGLVVKIARPDLTVTLMEPRQKRCAFLRHLIRSLKLTGITVLEERLEKNNPSLSNWSRSVPLFTSRAFTAIGAFLDLCADFSAPGGRVICMKGRKAEEEIAEWRVNHPDSLYRLTESRDLTLPISEIPRRLLVFTRD